MISSLPTRVALAAVVLISGCSDHGGDLSPAAQAAVVQAGTACERHLLSVADAQSVLRDHVVDTRPLPGDAQSCYFASADADRGGSQLLVTLRGSGGKATLATFRSGNMNAYATSRPAAGIGDEAIWLPDLHEIDARRGDVLCVVQPSALSETLLKAGDEAQQRAVGALCNKVFSALGAQGR